jgi:ribonuclease BN (tRNA processing enzyme)
MRLWAEIDGHEPPSAIHPAEPGTEIQLRRDLVVRPFEVNHPCHRRDRTAVPALGYCAVEVRQKLIEEYQNLSGPQLVELKKQGVEITRRMEIPLVAYCGDTAAGPFLDLEDVRRAKVLLLECTFAEPDHRDRARAGNHIHISDLRHIIPRLENERIVLIHLSRRTLLSTARKMLEREIGPEHAQRVSFFMEHRRRRRKPSTPETPDDLP